MYGPKQNMWEEDPRIRMLKQIQDPYTWQGIPSIDRPRVQNMALRMLGVSGEDEQEKRRQFEEQMRLQEITGLAGAHEKTKSPLGGQSAAGNALAKIIGNRYGVPSMYSYNGL